MTTNPKVAWDSNVLIDAIQKDAKWWPEIRPMYRDAIEGKIVILVSEISVAEVCRLNDPTNSGMSPQDAIKKIQQFFQNMFIERRPADRRESVFAAELIRDFNLETCDALIAATASIHGASVLYTRDGLRQRKNKISLLQCDGKIGTPLLAIKPPSAADYSKMPLFKKPDTTQNQPGPAQ